MVLITKDDGDQEKNAVNAPINAPKISLPCEHYMVKVIALDVHGGYMEIVECMQVHAPEIGYKAININRSSKGRFVSYSFRILAQSEDQLSKLHKDVMALDAVKMVL